MTFKYFFLDKFEPMIIHLTLYMFSVFLFEFFSTEISSLKKWEILKLTFFSNKKITNFLEINFLVQKTNKKSSIWYLSFFGESNFIQLLYISVILVYRLTNITKRKNIFPLFAFFDTLVLGLWTHWKKSLSQRT